MGLNESLEQEGDLWQCGYDERERVTEDEEIQGDISLGHVEKNVMRKCIDHHGEDGGGVCSSPQ